MAALVCSNCLTITKTPDVNIGKTAKCPKCASLEKIVSYDSGEDYIGRIVTNSGQLIEFDSVYMVPLSLSQQAQDLHAEASKKFAPKSFGLGFMGDLGFVAAASLATSSVEGLINRASASSGAVLLEQYAQLRLSLRYSGKFCKLGAIRQIQFADPTLWVSVQSDSGKSVQYTMQEDAFVCIRKVCGTPTSIRWSSVEEYWVPLDP